MAEQPSIPDSKNDNDMTNVASSDGGSNWLNMAKDKIKEIEEKTALKRIETIKKLIPKSVKDTLSELKLSKYSGKVKFFEISQDEIINKLKNEWDVLKLNELETANENIKWDIYLNECIKYSNDNRCYVNHAFWELVLNPLWIYCQEISSDIFNNSSDIQLCDTLNKCLCVCTLLDILKCTINTSASKKNSLLSRKTVINNVKLQNIINNCIGTKLDIEKWKKNGDEKKIYKNYAVCIQKEAMKSGKAFVKLYKIYKIKKHKEKKQQQQLVKEKVKKDTTEKETEEIKQENKQEIQENQENQNKQANKQENENKNKDSKFMYAIIVAVIVVILAILRSIIEQ